MSPRRVSTRLWRRMSSIFLVSWRGRVAPLSGNGPSFPFPFPSLRVISFPSSTTNNWCFDYLQHDPPALIRGVPTVRFAVHAGRWPHRLLWSLAGVHFLFLVTQLCVPTVLEPGRLL